MPVPRRTKCAHHWLLADEVVPLSRTRALQHPNCWGRPARCRLCGKPTILLEKVWEEQSPRSLRRSGRPPRQASDVVRAMKKAERIVDIEDFTTSPEPDLAELEYNL